MEFVEIRDLLAGKKLENTSDNFINKQWTDKKRPFKPVIGKNVTYVVAAVLFNEEGHVLLTQEGFHPHRGHWYLPAGRVDPGETLAEAAKREVREETGIEFEPNTLIAVEAPSGSWYRFTFTGRVTGGKLRTLDQQDWETLQGAYWPVVTVMNGKRSKEGDPAKDFILRGRDILKLIECGKRFHESETKPHVDILPCNEPHYGLYVRPLILCSISSEDRQSEEVFVLSMRRETAEQTKLPLLKFDPRLTSGTNAVQAFCQDAVKIHPSCVHIGGLLGVEHNGVVSQVTGVGDFHDGLLLTVLVKVHTKDRELPVVSDTTFWATVTDTEINEKLQVMSNETTRGGGAVSFMFS